MMVHEISEAISLPDRNSLKEWGNYLKLGFPVMIMMWSEDVAFWFLTLLSGLISVRAQAA